MVAPYWKGWPERTRAAWCWSLSVCLTVLAFHPACAGWLIFWALLPLATLWHTQGASARVGTGLSWGLAVHLIIFSFIRHVTWAGLFFLSLYHALYIALFALLWTFLPGALSRALVWVVLAWVRENLGPGSPFGGLHQPLADYPVWIQGASLGGALLVSFWVAFLNFYPLSRGPGRTGVVSRVALYGLLGVIPWLYGIGRLQSHPVASAPPGALRIGIIQPNIPPDLKWDKNRMEEQHRRLFALSEGFKPGELDLLVWPESALVNDPRLNPRLWQRVRQLALDLQCTLLIGTADELSHPEGDYNSAFLIHPQSDQASVYHKVNLVPFGETIPFQRWLPFMRLLTPIPQGFLAGDKLPLFVMEEQGIQFSPLICIEDMLGDFARRSVLNGADFLVTLTNDGWFPGLPGPLAHDQVARFRAVENGVPLVRCANTGISSWIDPLGRVRHRIQDARGRAEGVMGSMTVHLSAEESFPTPFRRFGYLWLGIATLCLAIGLAINRGIQRSP